MRQYYSAHSAEVPNFTLGAPGTRWTLIDSDWWNKWCRYTRFTTTAATAAAAATTAAGATAGDSTTTDATTAGATVPARRSSYTGAATAANTAAASSVHRYSRSYSTDISSVNSSSANALSASAAPPRPGQINNWRLRLPNSANSGDAHLVDSVREGRDYELIPPPVWDAFKVSCC